MFEDLYKKLVNIKKDKDREIGTVTDFNPLRVEIVPGDNEIEAIPTTNLFGIEIGSRVLLEKFLNQYIAVAVIGSPKVDCIEILKTTEQAITTTDATKIQFDSVSEQSGTNFILDSYGVKIGAGIKRVKVDCQCWFICDNTAAYSSLYIYQNSSIKSYGIWPKRATSSEYLTELWRTVHVSTFIEVAEGDYIYGYAKFSTADADNKIDDYSHATKLIVQCVEYNLS